MSDEIPIAGYTIFCDDIRHEVGGKVSLIGVYSSFLVADEFPIVLPKLGLHVIVLIPRDKGVNKLTMRVYGPGNEDDSSPEFEGEMDLAVKVHSDGARKSELVRVTQNLIFSDVPLQSAGKMRVRAVCDGEVVRLGVLSIITTQDANAEKASLTRPVGLLGPWLSHDSS